MFPVSPWCVRAHDRYVDTYGLMSRALLQWVLAER